MIEENVIKTQQQLYEKKAKGYFKHHGDLYSQRYRDGFIRNPLFRGIELQGKKVLDGMAAFGPETGFLIDKGAEVIGLDISPANAQLYREKWDLDCKIASIHETGFPDSYFDCVYICGGLHHIHPLLEETITEIYRILKGGGHFCFMEPNKDTWLNRIRTTWYRLDKRFDKNEEAISYGKQLKPFLRIGFKEIIFETGGNIAYILIAQSLIVGIPHLLKRLIYRPVFAIEGLLNKIPFVPRTFFIGVWQKTMG